MTARTSSEFDRGYDSGYLRGQYSTMSALSRFHKVFEHPVSSSWSPELAQLRADLVAEEANEVIEALGSDDRKHLAKELADLLYVTYGTCLALGIDPVRAFQAVHDSNMSKIWPDGKAHYREDGKVLKPPDYQPPDLSGALRSTS